MAERNSTQGLHVRPFNGRSHFDRGGSRPAQAFGLPRSLSSDAGTGAARRPINTVAPRRSQTVYHNYKSRPCIRSESTLKRRRTSYVEVGAHAGIGDLTYDPQRDYLPKLECFDGAISKKSATAMPNGNLEEEDDQQSDQRPLDTRCDSVHQENSGPDDLFQSEVRHASTSEPVAHQSPILLGDYAAVAPDQDAEPAPNHQSASLPEYHSPPVFDQARFGLEHEEWTLLDGAITPPQEHFQQTLAPNFSLSDPAVYDAAPDPFAPEPERRQGDTNLVDSTWDDEVAAIDPFAPVPGDTNDEHLKSTPQVHESVLPLAPSNLELPQGQEDGVVEQSKHIDFSLTEHFLGPQPDADQDRIAAESFAKQLRRFRTLTDEILLKRVHWRQENQKLETSRRYFSKSVKRLMSAMQIQPSADVYTGSPKTGKERKRRRAEKSAVDPEDTESNEPPLFSSSGTSSAVTTTDSSEAPQESSTSASPLTSNSNVLAAQDLVARDLRALSKQEEVVKGFMDELSNLEWHLNELERSISQQMRSSDFINELRIDMLNEEAATQDTASRPESKSETPPPLVNEYFDEMGNMGIYLERLHELDYNHQEGLVHRDFLKDRGEILDVSDEEFDHNYRIHRNDIEQKLNAARDAVADLAIRCEDAGLDPEVYRNAARGVYSPSASRSAHVDPETSLNVQQGSAVRHLPIATVGLGKSSRQIKSWLRGVMDESNKATDIAPNSDLSENRASRGLYPTDGTDLRPTDISLASFEHQSFDLELFGLPSMLESGYS